MRSLRPEAAVLRSLCNSVNELRFLCMFFMMNAVHHSLHWVSVCTQAFQPCCCAPLEQRPPIFMVQLQKLISAMFR